MLMWAIAPCTQPPGPGANGRVEFRKDAMEFIGLLEMALEKARPKINVYKKNSIILSQ